MYTELKRDGKRERKSRKSQRRSVKCKNMFGEESRIWNIDRNTRISEETRKSESYNDARSSWGTSKNSNREKISNDFSSQRENAMLLLLAFLYFVHMSSNPRSSSNHKCNLILRFSFHHFSKQLLHMLVKRKILLQH